MNFLGLKSSSTFSHLSTDSDRIWFQIFQVPNLFTSLNCDSNVWQPGTHIENHLNDTITWDLLYKLEWKCIKIMPVTTTAPYFTKERIWLNISHTSFHWSEGEMNMIFEWIPRSQLKYYRNWLDFFKRKSILEKNISETKHLKKFNKILQGSNKECLSCRSDFFYPWIYSWKYSSIKTEINHSNLLLKQYCQKPPPEVFCKKRCS